MALIELSSSHLKCYHLLPPTRTPVITHVSFSRKIEGEQKLMGYVIMRNSAISVLLSIRSVYLQPLINSWSICILIVSTNYFITYVAAFTRRLPCLETTIIKRKPIVFDSYLRKRINVAIQNTPLTTTLGIFDAIEDEYDGAIINPECLPHTSYEFAAMLHSSLAYWKLKGKKGIWLKILESQADLVPIALKAGFSYHHAEPGYVMLTYWIADEPCMLPSTATHQVGVGGFVINENREVLVVKEKCPLRCSCIWKLPTGLLDKSEDIFCGAIREVKEETGIDTCFLEVVAFSHCLLTYQLMRRRSKLQWYFR